jgi:hypothetical protein
MRAGSFHNAVPEIRYDAKALKEITESNLRFTALMRSQTNSAEGWIRRAAPVQSPTTGRFVLASKSVQQLSGLSIKSPQQIPQAQFTQQQTIKSPLSVSKIPLQPAAFDKENVSAPTVSISQ